MVVHAVDKPNNSINEMRRMAKSKKKGNEPEGKKKPILGAGRVKSKGQNDIPENELELKIAENEFKRRQWLMNWHMEVVEMQNELYDLEQCLQKSLVRSESAKTRDRAAKKEAAAAPQMTAEELQKLPVRMRPRPKYEPYVSRKERSEINLRSYERVVQSLHSNPREFDVITPDISTDASHFHTSKMSDSDRFKLLILKNPFRKQTERENLLAQIKLQSYKDMSARGIAPKRMIVSSRGGGPTTLPTLRAATMIDMRETGSKSVRFDGSQEHLPSINAQRATDTKPKTAPEVKAGMDKSTRLPVVVEATKHSQLRPATSLGSRSTKSGRSSPISSTYSSLSDSDDVSESMATGRKARKKKRVKDDTKPKEKLQQVSTKQEPNLLDNAEFRRKLIEELDKKRLDRIENTKWGLAKNTFKASTLLKVQMPDVIRDAATSKHHNRAIEQVQERIKARAVAESQAGINSMVTPANPTSNLVRSKGLSRSMPILSK